MNPSNPDLFLSKKSKKIVGENFDSETSPDSMGFKISEQLFSPISQVNVWKKVCANMLDKIDTSSICWSEKIFANFYLWKKKQKFPNNFVRSLFLYCGNTSLST